MCIDPADSSNQARPLAGNGLRQVPVSLLPELADAAWRAGFAINHIALHGVVDKAGLLAAVASGLSFPPGLGGNWDGLADALDDLSWLDGQAHGIVIDGANDVREQAPEVLDTLIQIIDEVAAARAEAGLPFQVFLSDAPMPTDPD